MDEGLRAAPAVEAASTLLASRRPDASCFRAVLGAVCIASIMKELTLFETTRAHSACHSVEFRLPKVKNVLTVLGTLSAGALSASPRCSSSAHPFKSNFLFRPATDDAIVMSTAAAGLRSSAGPRDSRAIKVQTRLF